ncbi:SpoVK/Ycf46/Vps4 family AAA+-type ATPase [Evansella vedderi]|uniref:SpoVK/Ycf46/Vps4 family AAA+-type ATPase n=1 Tax=Evansella vedderi TaxID=38282 RepID=A0ABU0A240_9BACI|nr:AAA family ATPase [Evansella vedderi]MDQ0257542.1 SpoVK/Ycf46/Vps4 family AAA+-type ATPase [Evansella vedderi]
MEQEKKKAESLQQQIDKQQNMAFHKINEAVVVRLLTQLEEASSKTLTEYHINRARLLAMAAVARFHRIGELDGKIEERLGEALELSPDDRYVSKVVIHIHSTLLNQRFLIEDIPKIRETDHSQGKKKTIQRIKGIITDALQRTETLLKQLKEYEHAAHIVDERSKLDQADQGKEILQNSYEQLKKTLVLAEQYEATISGIYSSREKLESYQESLRELNHLSSQWANWLEVFGQEEEVSALKKLQSMVGLTEVKNKIEQYYHYLRYQEERRKKGYQLQSDPSLNMILTGNPGTGKTELARQLARIYHELGVLPKEKVLEVDRSQLVGAYVGQTEEKTMNVIKEAVGGVLFIDEAYSLKRADTTGNDYGQAAIDTLVAAMTNEEYAGKFAVILAGYPEEMRTFLWSNPGLRSRFPEHNHIHLPDYSLDELVEIGEQTALENDFSLTESALTALRYRLEQEKVDDSFGNARAVKNIIQEAIFKKGSEVAKTKDYRKENFILLDEEAFEPRDRKKNDKSGDEQLNELIGLTEVKDQVRKLTSFVKVQQMRKDSGLPVVPIQLHAIFSGPPGTGKTTVAKIYGDILCELGLLKRGHMVISGRSDLVAGYVGQTAMKTKKKIKEALGGVLFIDEAYSLLAKGEQDFGKEAIDTLVEEMTKHNENLVVILAGYSQPMELLMESNPGLSSRFKKTIAFQDYTAEELIEILVFYVKKLGYSLDGAIKKELYETLKASPPSGNGRAMRDMVEEAIQQQAYRIVSEKQGNVSDLTKLVREDFSILIEGERN